MKLIKPQKNTDKTKVLCFLSVLYF